MKTIKNEPDQLSAEHYSEEAWIHVIHEMERVYSEMVQNQMELELKNQELEEANSFISNILLSMNEVLIVFNRYGEIIQANETLVNLTGLAKSDLLTTQVTDYFDSGSQNLILTTFSGHSIPQAEMELKSHGKWIPLIVSCSPMNDSQGVFLGMVLVGHEISALRKAHKKLNESHFELQRTQEQLVQSEKMASLGRLVAGVAHELNNPVSFIYGNTHALTRYAKRLGQFFDRLDQPEENITDLKQELRIDKILSDLPSLLEGSREGVERIRDIVLDLRQFSAGELKEFSRFDLCHTVQTAVRWISNNEKARIILQQPEQLLIEGLSGRIHQVVMNLIQNACDALENIEQPEVQVKLFQEGQNAVIKIQDNGSGIPEEILTNIFEPFFTTKHGKGTGLGLSLSYNFVIQHHGSLVANNLPDQGAEFTLILPMSQPNNNEIEP